MNTSYQHALRDHFILAVYDYVYLGLQILNSICNHENDNGLSPIIGWCSSKSDLLIYMNIYVLLETRKTHGYIETCYLLTP